MKEKRILTLSCMTLMIKKRMLSVFRIRRFFKKRKHTEVIFVNSAGTTFWAIMSIHQTFLQKSFLTFSYPPIFQSPEKDFSSAWSADLISRSICIGFRSRSYPMNIYEQLELDKSCKTSRLFLNELDNL
jgi:hypothetical protein